MSNDIDTNGLKELLHDITYGNDIDDGAVALLTATIAFIDQTRKPVDAEPLYACECANVYQTKTHHPECPALRQFNQKVAALTAAEAVIESVKNNEHSHCPSCTVELSTSEHESDCLLDNYRKGDT